MSSIVKNKLVAETFQRKRTSVFPLQRLELGDWAQLVGLTTLLLLS